MIKIGPQPPLDRGQDFEEALISQRRALHNRRVLHILGGTAYGGTTEVVYPIAKRLVSAGCQVDIVVSDPAARARFKDIHVGLIDIPSMVREIRPWKDAAAFIALLRLMMTRRYDVVHTHTSKGGVLGRLAAWVARTPAIIHHLHGFAFHEYSGRIQTWVYQRIEWVMSAFCDRIISVNEEDRATAIEAGLASE